MPELTITAGSVSAPRHADPLLPLAVRDLEYHAGAEAIIRGVSFDIRPRGCTVIMGYNGAGKSVLLRMLHGLLTPSAGTIDWHTRVSAAELRRRQAMVFQYPVVLRRSVAQNIRYALRTRGVRGQDAERRLATLLRDSDLLGHAERPAGVLSGGERQRLALARALSTDPEILFLDEPTASLDPASATVVERLVVAARDAGTKVVLVSQNVAQARRLAHDVIFLHGGRVLEHTDAESFFAAPHSTAARAFIDGRFVA